MSKLPFISKYNTAYQIIQYEIQRQLLTNEQHFVAESDVVSNT